MAIAGVAIHLLGVISTVPIEFRAWESGLRVQGLGLKALRSLKSFHGDLGTFLSSSR